MIGVLQVVVSAVLAVVLTLHLFAARRRPWEPDVSRAFEMAPPRGWRIRAVTLMRDELAADVVTVTLQREPADLPGHGNRVEEVGL